MYVVGTGDTGGAKTFLTLGAAYFTAMVAGAMGQRVPREGWKPKVRYDAQSREGNTENTENVKSTQAITADSTENMQYLA